ncbi:CRISPR-associated endonuclease Cas1 [Verrucomicrobium sp. BvORR106]|uniref:CRISPR-associated endonuclease Cas4g/Cas1g n=1 Tax=Verrucomicrobium sp. BvORR106 TaxID=1403819 RepID=UPI0007C69558|nr:CRISPR-associated endonuclease Cas1 [Verrucomicrobium sp. BvORR106]
MDPPTPPRIRTARAPAPLTTGEEGAEILLPLPEAQPPVGHPELELFSGGGGKGEPVQTAPDVAEQEAKSESVSAPVEQGGVTNEAAKGVGQHPNTVATPPVQGPLRAAPRRLAVQQQELDWGTPALKTTAEQKAEVPRPLDEKGAAEQGLEARGDKVSPETPEEFEPDGLRFSEVVAKVDPGHVPETLPQQEVLPSRMLNEFVYCPRLFYYEYVEGVFVANADTERGSALHAKVDKGKGDLPQAKKAAGGKKGAPNAEKEGDDGDWFAEGAKAAADPDEVPDEGGAISQVDATSENVEVEPDGGGAGAAVEEKDGDRIIHSRSATLSSVRLGVLAKMDLIEVRMGTVTGEKGAKSREIKTVTPVDYKAGAPKKGADANELWDADKMQLGLQILILRDNGYQCEEGVIYYRATKQRVRLPMTEGLERWIIAQIALARETARGPMPPPLVGSPKCVRCSLAPVCLPDETWMLAERKPQREEGLPEGELAGEAGSGKQVAANGAPRRLMAARDDARALYLSTPGYHVGRSGELLVVKDGAAVVEEFRLSDLTHVALFGNVQMTTQAVQVLCEKEIPLAYFSTGGWFYGLTRGHATKNVFTRIEQFRAADDPMRCLAVSRKFVAGKIRNHRTLLMRLHVEPPAAVLARLKQASQDALGARSLEELLGIEGAAAALYLQHFAGMIKVGAADDDDEIPGLESASATRAPEESVFTFDFTKRSRRPPTDPVNALLSLAYSLLAKDCTIAAHAVGFDPYVGFYHQPRYGRPALALDLMEEFRPLVAESVVLTAINNRMLVPDHFVRAGEGVNLTSHGRKVFFQAYEQRMGSIITHPVFDYKVSYRRVLELQARILARYLTGEIKEYIPMVTR